MSDLPNIDDIKERFAFKVGDEAEIANHLEALCRHNGIIYSEGQYWKYDETKGVFVCDGIEDLLYKVVQELSGAQVGKESKLRVSTGFIRGALEMLQRSIAQKDFFRDAVPGLACTNCFARLMDGKVITEPHSKEHKARAAYPLRYDAQARAPQFEKFLLELFAGEADAPEKMSCLLEFLGSSLFGIATKFQTALMLTGKGSNGKGTLLTIARAVFPEGTCTAVKPQDLGREYYSHGLQGALLNAVGDIPSASILTSEDFKAVIAGDLISGREVRGKVIHFVPVAGHLFSANSLPGTNDHTHGYWRRWLVIEFLKCFTGQEDRDIAARIIASEGPGILALFAAGAAKALAKGRYTVPRSSEVALNKWKNDSDNVLQWIEECTKPVDTHEEGRETKFLYLDYKTWASNGGYKPVALNKFGERLNSLGHEKSGKEQKTRKLILLAEAKLRAARVA